MSDKESRNPYAPPLPNPDAHHNDALDLTPDEKLIIDERRQELLRIYDRPSADN